MKYFAILFSIVWLGMLFLSFSFQYGHQHTQRPIVLFVVLWVLLFVVLMLTAWGYKKSSMSWQWVLAFGLLFRLLMVFSNPIQEDDFYRYLWDGAVLAEGVNPYKFSPSEIQEVGDSSRYVEALSALELADDKGNSPFSQEPKILVDDMKKLRNLGNDLRIGELFYDKQWQGVRDIPVLDRVNFPAVPSVYPPVSQLFFMTSAWIKPGSLYVLRCLFVLVECLTMYLIVRTLMVLKRDPALVFWYAWNPLVIKELINSPHLDVLMVCATAGLLYFWVQGARYKWALMLGIGILAKYFIVPATLFVLLWKKKQAFVPCLLVAVIVLLGFLMFHSAGSRQFQGLKTMGATGWNTNSVLVKCLEKPVAQVIKAVGQDPDEEIKAYTPFYIFSEKDEYHIKTIQESWMRFILSIIALLWLLRCLWKAKNVSDKREQIVALGCCLMGLFLLSPIANPWYAAVLMLFLPFCERRVFLTVLGTVLGFYYLKFHIEYNESGKLLFHSFRNIVLLEGLILLLAFWLEWGILKRSTGVNHGSN